MASGAHEASEVHQIGIDPRLRGDDPTIEGACKPATRKAARMFKRAVSFNRGMIQAVDSISEVAVTGSRVSLAQMRELGDYKLYAVPEPTTIAARQSKQVHFLREKHVPFTRVYTFRAVEESIMDDNDFAPRRAAVLLRLQNKKSEGLGKPLPAGVVSVMETNGAAPILAGQDSIDDTPVGLPLELELGLAMHVWIEPRVTEDRTIVGSDRNEERLSVEVRLGNDKPVPITLEYRQPSEGAGFRIVRESRPHTLKDGDIRWTLRLRPGQRAVLRYTMQRSQ